MDFKDPDLAVDDSGRAGSTGTAPEASIHLKYSHSLSLLVGKWVRVQVYVLTI